MAIGVLSSLLILLLQVYYGVIPKSLTFVSFLSITYPYLGIIVIAFLISVARAPYLLDRDRQATIDALTAEGSKQDDQGAAKARRRQLREELGKLYTEGKKTQWSGITHAPGWNAEHTQWLNRVKDFLSKEPEFDGSHLARFDATRLQALDEFIKEQI